MMQGQQPGMQQQMGYQPMQQQPIVYTQTVTTANTVPHYAIRVHETHSYHTRCYHCGQENMTRVEQENGAAVWGIFLLLLIFGFWCCSFYPFCIDDLKDVFHYCPSCATQIAYKKGCA
jgi:hypothetical protein